MAHARVLNNPSLLVLSFLLHLHICFSSSAIIRQRARSTDKYIVVLEAGTLCTIAHIFGFDENLNLLKINGQFDPQFKVHTGLTEVADNPEDAATLLAPLLQNAVNAVPENQRPETPLIVGASEELWLLGEEKREEILQVVRDLSSKTSLDTKWVKVLPGSQQGVYMWAAVNYLLGNIGGDYSKTVSVLDQELASVETTYAVSNKVGKEAKKDATKSGYITKHYFNGTKYYLYSHGYWLYGAYASRGKLLKYTNDSYTYCAVNGTDKQFDYYGAVYNLRSSTSGSNYEKCRAEVLRTLNLNAACYVKNCTFDGVWNGGGGAGVKDLYMVGGFHHTGVDLGFIKRTSSEIRIRQFENASKVSCSAKSLEEVHELFPNVPLIDLPCLCMDVVQLYSILVDGLSVEPRKVVTAADKIKYGEFYMGAGWPLGAALEIVSSNYKREPSITDIRVSLSNPSVKIA